MKKVALRHGKELEKLKAPRHWAKPDFIWEALLLSMATMGNSRGAVLVENPHFHSQVEWATLDRLEAHARLTTLDQTLRRAKVRMPSVKSQWLHENFEEIGRRGGPAMVKEKLQSLAGRDTKIKYLLNFRGIGPKYARNILMDVYHSDFRESIAIDERIKKVLSAIGHTSENYSKTEHFLLEVAHGAGLNGWEMDRLIYNYTDEVLAGLRIDGGHNGIN